MPIDQDTKTQIAMGNAFLAGERIAGAIKYLSLYLFPVPLSVPVKALGAAFRHRVCRLLEVRDREEKTRQLAALDGVVWRKPWVVDVRAVERGQAAVRYLARYVH